MSLAILTFLLLVRTVFTESDEIAGTLSAQASLKALGCLMPTLLTLTLPMSLLVGTLLGIGRLTVDSEVKAFRTHGVNLFRTFVPILVFGSLTAGLILANSLYFAPWMMSKIYNLFDSATLGIVDAVEPGRFVDRFSVEGQDVVFYFKERDPETKQLKNVYMCMEGGDAFNLTGKREQGAKPKRKTARYPRRRSRLDADSAGHRRAASPADLGLGATASQAATQAFNTPQDCGRKTNRSTRQNADSCRPGQTLYRRGQRQDHARTGGRDDPFHGRTRRAGLSCVPFRFSQAVCHDGWGWNRTVE
jgi:lipopolysaccharide export LptBFGC system permease protein LptF